MSIASNQLHQQHFQGPKHTGRNAPAPCRVVHRRRSFPHWAGVSQTAGDGVTQSLDKTQKTCPALKRRECDHRHAAACCTDRERYEGIRQRLEANTPLPAQNTTPKSSSCTKIRALHPSPQVQSPEGVRLHHPQGNKRMHFPLLQLGRLSRAQVQNIMSALATQARGGKSETINSAECGPLDNISVLLCTQAQPYRTWCILSAQA